MLDSVDVDQALQTLQLEFQAKLDEQTKRFAEALTAAAVRAAQAEERAAALTATAEAMRDRANELEHAFRAASNEAAVALKACAELTGRAERSARTFEQRAFFDKEALRKADLALVRCAENLVRIEQGQQAVNQSLSSFSARLDEQAQLQRQTLALVPPSEQASAQRGTHRPAR